MDERERLEYELNKEIYIGYLQGFDMGKNTLISKLKAQIHLKWLKFDSKSLLDIK